MWSRFSRTKGVAWQLKSAGSDGSAEGAVAIKDPIRAKRPHGDHQSHAAAAGEPPPHTKRPPRLPGQSTARRAATLQADEAAG